MKKDWKRLEKTLKLRNRFSKPQIKEIRKNLYDIKNSKNLSTQKTKEIEKSLFKLEEHLSNFKKYRFQDDFEHKNLRDAGNLFNEIAFNQSIDKDYYKLIKTADSFDNKNNYMEYQSKGDQIRNSSFKQYLYMIILYLWDIINDHKAHGNLNVHSSNEVIDYKTEGERKIQLSMKIYFVSSKDSDEIRTIHTKSDNIDILMGRKTYDIIKERFKSRLQKFQEELEESMWRSGFIVDGVNLLEYKLNKIKPRRGCSYIDSLKWLKNKKARINPKNNDNNCFQYALAIAFNFQNVQKDQQRISKIKPLINQYNWKEIDLPLHPQKDWKKFELDNKTIALNILFVPYNTEEIRLAYKSKYNFKRKSEVTLLMITDGKNWHYLAIKSLSALLGGITSNHNGNFHCSNCFHSYSTKK